MLIAFSLLSIGVDHSCTAFVSVPGPLQTVQRAELSEVILALQSAEAVHIGVDNLGVVRHVGRLLDGGSFPPSPPLELVTDGDLLILIRRLIDLRGSNTVRVTKVKGHADEGWLLPVVFVSLIGLVIMLQMRQLTLVVGGLPLLLLMPVVICLGFVVAGILLFLIYIGSLLLFLALCLIMTVLLVLLLIRCLVCWFFA